MRKIANIHLSLDYNDFEKLIRGETITKESPRANAPIQIILQSYRLHIISSDSDIVSEIYRLLNIYFEGDFYKVSTWMKTHNPALGSLAPWQMILLGKGNRLVNFIKNRLEGNNP